MKVLHVGKFYPPHRGGMETHLQCLAEGLQQHLDLQVIVAGDDRGTKNEVVNGVRVCRVGNWGQVASASFCPGLTQHIRSTPADIVHIHWPNPTAIAAWLASRHPGRLVITYHSDVIRQRVLSQMFMPVLNRVLGRADAIIATSPDYIRSSEVLTRWRDKCHVLPFGVPAHVFEGAESASVSRIRNHFQGPIIISVGRLVYYKGFEYLIRAMADVPGTLLIIGEGPLREPLRKLIARLGMQSRVHLLQGVTDEELRVYYSAADVFVMSSIARSEAFGLVQVEAMAAGIPVINTQLASGVPYVSKHAVTGLTVPPGDVAGLRTALTMLLTDEALRRRYGNAARLRAETEFRASYMVDQTRALYESILASTTMTGRTIAAGAHAHLRHPCR